MFLMLMLFDQAGIPLGNLLHVGLMSPSIPLLLVGKVGKVVGWGMARVFQRHTPFTLTTAFSHQGNSKKNRGTYWPSKFVGRLGLKRKISPPT